MDDDPAVSVLIFCIAASASASNSKRDAVAVNNRSIDWDRNVILIGQCASVFVSGICFAGSFFF